MNTAANYAQFKIKDMNKIVIKNLKNNTKTISMTAAAISFGIVIFFIIKYFYLKPKMRANKLLNPNQEFIPIEENLGSRAKIYLFYATWCPHSKNAMPEWNRFKSRVKGNNIQYNMVEFEEIDGDDENNESVLKRFNIDSFPLVRMLYNTKIYIFEGKITEDNLNGFLQQFVTFPKKKDGSPASLKNTE